MSEFFKILPRRMPEASLPAHATNGELIITTDTDKAFVGRGPTSPLVPLIGAAPTFGPISSFSVQPLSDNTYSVPAPIGPFTVTGVSKQGPVYAVYQGTITGGDHNMFSGYRFIITGFSNTDNNGTFLCCGSSDTTLVLINAAAVDEAIDSGTAANGQPTNNGVGCFGFVFQVSSNISVSELGRLYISGNTRNHAINLWDPADTVTPLASGTVLASSPSDTCGVKWVSISPVVLTPRVRYYIAIDEDISGDAWLGSLQQYYLQPQFPLMVNTPDGVGINIRAVSGTTSQFPDIAPGVEDRYGVGRMFDAPAMKYTYTER